MGQGERAGLTRVAIQGNNKELSKIRTGPELIEWEDARQAKERAKQIRRVEAGGYDSTLQDSVVKALFESESPDILSTCITLLDQQSSAQRSVRERLKELVRFPSVDVWRPALYRYCDSPLRDESAMRYREFLGEPNNHVRSLARELLLHYGDDPDVPMFADYVRSATLRGRNWGITGSGKTEVSSYCDFLDVFIEQCPEVERLYRWMLGRWNRIPKIDRTSLLRHQPFLGQHSGRKWVVIVSDGKVASKRINGGLHRGLPGVGFTTISLGEFHLERRLRRAIESVDFVVAVSDGGLAARTVHALRSDIPMVQVAEPRYQAISHDHYSLPTEGTVPEWRELADKEDAELLPGLIEAIQAVPVRHARDKPV